MQSRWRVTDLTPKAVAGGVHDARFRVLHKDTKLNLAALKAELDNDPEGIGYAGMSDVDVSEALNTRNRESDADTLQAGDLVAALHPKDVQAASSADRAYLQIVASAGTVPLTPTLKQGLKTVLGAQSDTLKELTRHMRQAASRAKELGLGRVTPSDVADARRL
jgi:hypothetical protein